MADNVTVRQGAGSNTKTIAADDVGGAMYQRVKVSTGLDGTATDVSTSNPLPVSGEVTVESPATSLASITTASSSTSSAQLLPANEDRIGLFIINTDANAALIKFGAIASSSSFTLRLMQYSQFEMAPPIYLGRIDIIWEGDGSGGVIVTEMT